MAPSSSSAQTNDPKSEHKHTFQCLKSCAEWYVMAACGASTVSIPCTKLAVQFTDNKEEQPLLEEDILDLIIKQESELSVS